MEYINIKESPEPLREGENNAKVNNGEFKDKYIQSQKDMIDYERKLAKCKADLMKAQMDLQNYKVLSKKLAIQKSALTHDLEVKEAAIKELNNFGALHSNCEKDLAAAQKKLEQNKKLIKKMRGQILKNKRADLKPTLKVLFSRIGSIAEVRKHIQKFSGFPREFTKKKESLEKITLTGLKEICSVLHIDNRGTKEEIMTKVMSFLLNPDDSGKKPPAPKENINPNMESSMSPVAGPSHSHQDENSMMYVDQTNTFALSAAGSYHNSSALMSSDGQLQGKEEIM